MSKGALYLYFKSKEQLFEELCRTVGRALEEDLNSAFSGPNVEEGADAYFDKIVGRGAARASLWMQTLAVTESNRVVQKLQEDIQARVLDVLTNFVGELKNRGMVRRDLDTISVARVFSALHDGVLISLLQEANESTARATWKEGLRLLLKGMSP